MKRRPWPIGLAALLLAVLPLNARAGETMTETHQKSAVPGWQEFVDNLQSLPDRMLAKLPEEMRNDPRIRQEIARIALESLTTSTLEAIGGDGDAPQFLPSIGQVLNVGQPNADTIYRSARVTPGASYRLRGVAGSLNHSVIAQVVPAGSQGAGSRSHLHLSDLALDPDGRFDVLVSSEKPEGYEGDWWQLAPGATRLMLRMVSSDWADEESPTISIERIDQPVARPRPPAAQLEAKLRALPQQIDFMALMFVDHVEKLREKGVVNRLEPFNVGFGSLDGQFYYEGAYDLADDEALIVESTVPDVCQYRSLILTNDLFETTDWVNNHSSLNGSQAAPDGDGKLRIVVSEKDPGVKNWLDTAGSPRGVIQGRWTGCDSQPIPEVRKVKLGDVAKSLPADTAMVTPEERQDIIRERRRALLERPYW
ncbi:MAG: DUF1214 domain-containing protein [Novosphingobium sp.]|nr:DUF1214 domain-containing protein [Novosphingobium sp.]